MLVASQVDELRPVDKGVPKSSEIKMPSDRKGAKQFVTQAVFFSGPLGGEISPPNNNEFRLFFLDILHIFSPHKSNFPPPQTTSLEIKPVPKSSQNSKRKWTRQRPHCLKNQLQKEQLPQPQVHL